MTILYHTTATGDRSASVDDGTLSFPLSSPKELGVPTGNAPSLAAQIVEDAHTMCPYLI